MTFTESWLVIAGVVALVGVLAVTLTLGAAYLIATFMNGRAYQQQLAAPGLRRRKVS